MREPTKIEFTILLFTTVAYAAINISNHGWKGIFTNYTIFGGFVSGWVWCLVFHRK